MHRGSWPKRERHAGHESRDALDNGQNRDQLHPSTHSRGIRGLIAPSANRVDIYQVHWPDPLVPIEETAATLHELYQQGKIRAIGVSNYSPEQMERFKAVAPLHPIQPPYNLFQREVERDVLPYAIGREISTLTYGALCRRLLSGAMNA